MPKESSGGERGTEERVSKTRPFSQKEEASCGNYLSFYFAVQQQQHHLVYVTSYQKPCIIGRGLTLCDDVRWLYHLRCKRIGQMMRAPLQVH